MLFDALTAANPSLLVVLALSLVAAGTVKGTIGVGMPVVALPLLSAFVEVRAAVALLSLPLVLSNIPQALENGAAVARRAWPLASAMRSAQLRARTRHPTVRATRPERAPRVVDHSSALARTSAGSASMRPAAR